MNSKMILSAAGLALGLIASPATAVTQFAGNGHLYEFVATNLSWQGALAAAAAATPIPGTPRISSPSRRRARMISSRL